MPEEFEGDLSGAVFWGAELRDATFRDVDLTGVRITHSVVADVEIDAMVQRLVVNGVDVTDYVNERDRWYPLRTMLRPNEPDDIRTAWAAFDSAWAATVHDAHRLPDAALHEQVDGQWSFVETVRHLVFATDKWFTVPILGGTFHPIGLPNTGSRDLGWPGVDLDADPTTAHALDAWNDRWARFGDYARALTAPEDGTIQVIENGELPRAWSAHVVFEELFWHNRYATRDLAVLAARPDPLSP